MAHKQKSYQADEKTEALLKELREGFGVTSDSAVIRRALALSRLLIRDAGEDHVVRVIGKDDTTKEIILAG